MGKQKQITVFTIVYNEYGRFIPQWVKFLKKQTIETEILIILGKNHDANINYLKKNKIKYVYFDSDKMGVLRNVGVQQIETKWWLYFSVDDELLPFACEEIVKTKADAVSILFDIIEPNGKRKEKIKSPCINSIENLENWRKFWGGYVAVKNNTDIRFLENIEVPNITLHFELFKRGLKTKQSKRSLAIHHRWKESHHFRSEKNGSRKKCVKTIELQKEKAIKEYNELKINKKIKNFKKSQKVKSKVITHLIKENIDVKIGTIFEVKGEERLKQLLDLKYVEVE